MSVMLWYFDMKCLITKWNICNVFWNLMTLWNQVTCPESQVLRDDFFFPCEIGCCVLRRASTRLGCSVFPVHCSTLQHTATHCYTLQHTATHCNTLLHTATHCNTLQHAATHCNTLQHTATHCSTLQHTATHCNTLQHTSTERSKCCAPWCVGVQ